MNKVVLVVTDYSGNLHITPASNKGYYQSRNAVIKDKQFRFKEGLSESEAEQYVNDNNGQDPVFITPAKAAAVIADKDVLIEQLKAQLEAANKKTVTPAKAEDVIAQIVAATTEDEVNKLVEGEIRKTVVDAATKKLEEFKK